MGDSKFSLYTAILNYIKYLDKITYYYKQFLKKKDISNKKRKDKILWV